MSKEMGNGIQWIENENEQLIRGKGQLSEIMK